MNVIVLVVSDVIVVILLKQGNEMTELGSNRFNRF